MTRSSDKAPDGTSAKPARRGRFARYLFSAPKLHLILIFILAGGLLASLTWRFVSVVALEDTIAEVKQHARAGMIEQSNELLRLSATPMAWAIRAEMLANDAGDIDAYMTKLVTEKYVRRIVLVDASGTVVASTNIKLKGQPAAAALPGVALAATEPQVSQAGTDLRMIVPVMDFERQIGTLVLDYASQSIDSKLPR